MDAPEEEPSATADDGIPPEVAALLEKQPFRGYELRSVLSHDDHGAVFKGHDNTMDRTVAVKVMRPATGREGVVEEFFSLAGSIAQLRCPGTARGLDAGRGDGNFFMVYEFLPGESLRARLARRVTGCLTEKESLPLIRELATVLQNLFDLGHPHGNLHPGNVITGEGGKPRLAGIGFAWSLAWPDEDAACRARPDWLPPERIANELGVDIRGDLYSLGAMWFAMLTGRPAFVGDTPEETLRMHCEDKPPKLRDFEPKATAETGQLINWLLEKDRDRRPRTPKEFLRKLAAHPLLAENTAEGEDAALAAEDDAETVPEPMKEAVGEETAAAPMEPETAVGEETYRESAG